MTGYAHPPLVVGGLYNIPDMLGCQPKEAVLLLQIYEEQGLEKGHRRMTANFLYADGHQLEIVFLFGGPWHAGVRLVWKP